MDIKSCGSSLANSSEILNKKGRTISDPVFYLAPRINSRMLKTCTGVMSIIKLVPFVHRVAASYHAGPVRKPQHTFLLTDRYLGGWWK
jgi:hypothetical protein